MPSRRTRNHVPPTQPSKRRGPLALIEWLLVRAVAAVLLLVMGYFGYRYVVVDRLDEEIRARVETKFREHYQGLHVSIEAAHRVEGAGIEIRGLTIREVDRPQEPPLLYIDRIFTACCTDLKDLMTHEPEVTKVVLRQARIHAVRRRSGFWNVQHLLPPPQFGSCTPPIVWEQGQVEIVDEAHPERSPPQWRDLHVSLTPDAAAAESLGLSADTPQRVIRVSGNMTGDHFREVRLEGAVDMVSQRWSLRGEVEQLEFTPAMREKLPQDLAAELAPIASVSANTHLRFEMHNLAGEGQPLQFRVTGTMSEGRIDDDRLPLPLTELSAKIFADNEGFKIDDFRARLGAANLNLSLRLDGYEASSPLVLRIAAQDLSLDERLANVLPPEASRLWNQASPSGIAHGKATIAFDGRTWTPEVEATLEQLSFTYDKFPYRINDGGATVTLRDGLLVAKGHGYAGNSRIAFEGEVYEPGSQWHGWMEARSEEPVPIDERLLQALKPEVRAIAEALSVRGSVKLLGRLDRREGTQRPAHVHIDAELQNCSIQYRHFDYPIDHISGMLRGSDGVWSFVNLKGSQGTAQLTASGGYGPDVQGPLFTLAVRASDVPLDEALRRALPPETQKLWSDVRPRGQLSRLDVDVSYRPLNKKLTVEVDAQKLAAATDRGEEPVHIVPVWFPYAIDVSSGVAKYRDGQLTLAKIRGTHGKTKIESDGMCRWGDGAWSLQFDRLSADRLQLDHDLLAALPADAGAALAKARFAGNVGMMGAMQFSGDRTTGGMVDAQWDLAFDIEDGRIASEVPVEHIQGGLRLTGGSQRGSWFSRGEMRFDSLFVRDVQLTQVFGPFYADSKQLLLGTWAEKEVRELPPRQLTAQVFQGLLSTDGAVSLGDDGKFTLACKLEQANLAAIARETSAPTSDVQGKVFGVLQMSGTTRGKHTWRGGGNVRLREANLYKVPVMLAMLKLLSVQAPNDTAFTSSDIDFRLQGDDVILDRIELAGDAVTLKGRGQLFEQKQVDLLFYTQVGRRDIQALRPLLAEASPNFLLIEVTGTIDHPSVKKTAFPALNETLRELFPDLAGSDDARDPRREARSPLPLVRSPWRR